jgi:hypothetical protein
MTAAEVMVSDEAKYSTLGRASRIYSVLQSTMYLADSLSLLSPQERGVLIGEVAALIAPGAPEGMGRKVIQLIQTHVPDFAQSWDRFEAEGRSASRLSVIEQLARGEYS